MEYSVQILVNGLIPNSQHAKAMMAQVAVALHIVSNFFCRTVCRTIKLDYQSERNTREVCKVRSDGVLSAKPSAEHLFRAKP